MKPQSFFLVFTIVVLSLQAFADTPQARSPKASDWIESCSLRIVQPEPAWAAPTPFSPAVIATLEALWKTPTYYDPPDSRWDGTAIMNKLVAGEQLAEVELDWLPAQIEACRELYKFADVLIGDPTWNVEAAFIPGKSGYGMAVGSLQQALVFRALDQMRKQQWPGAAKDLVRALNLSLPDKEFPLTSAAFRFSGGMVLRQIVELGEKCDDKAVLNDLAQQLRTFPTPLVADSMDDAVYFHAMRRLRAFSRAGRQVDLKSARPISAFVAEVSVLDDMLEEQTAEETSRKVVRRRAAEKDLVSYAVSSREAEFNDSKSNRALVENAREKLAQAATR